MKSVVEKTDHCRSDAPSRRAHSSTRPNPRTSAAAGTPIHRKDGVWDGEVADRVLYSQLVHADDARDVLDTSTSVGRTWDDFRIVMRFGDSAPPSLGQSGDPAQRGQVPGVRLPTGVGQQ